MGAEIPRAWGLNINLEYDSSVTSLANAAQIESACGYAVGQYGELYSDPITINIDVVANSSVPLTDSSTYGYLYPYTLVQADLIANASSADQQQAVSTLPLIDPAPSGSILVSIADQRALGIAPASSTAIDGTFSFNPTRSYTFDPYQRSVTGEIDFIGAAEHEISEVMGRTSSLASGFTSVLDLYRYSGPGTRALSSSATPAYFSINSGSTDLNNFNTAAGEDLGDWAGPTADSYDASVSTGSASTLNSIDTTTLDVLGYNPNPTTLSWAGGTADFVSANNWSTTTQAGINPHVNAQLVLNSPGALAIHHFTVGENFILGASSDNGQSLQVSNGTFAIGALGATGTSGFGLVFNQGGFLTADTNGIINVAGPLSVGDAAGSIFASATFTGSSTVEVGTVAGTTQVLYAGKHGNGTVAQSGNSIVSAPTVELGDYAGADGIYSLAGGTLSAANVYVGYSGTGAFVQSGGLQTDGALDLAYLTHSTGTFVLSGGMLAAGSVYVGGAITAAGGTSVLTVNNSGLLSVSGPLKVWTLGTANLDVPMTSVGSLSIYSTGIVNLNGALAVNFGSPAADPVATILGYLKNGYAAGTWNGTSGIISTSAHASSAPLLSVGYSDGNTDTATAAAANQVLVKLTLAGDANLDGAVDFNDLFAVGKYLNTTGNDWAEGNFNYDPAGSVNFNDLFVIGQNLNQSLNTMSMQVSNTDALQAEQVGAIDAVPEPVLLGFASIAGMGLLGRRRRRRKMRVAAAVASCCILDSLAPAARAQTAVTFTINSQQSVQSISPFIYGINQALAGYNNPTYLRLGGDRWTAYNWVTNASNAGSDFNYSNDNYLGGGNTPGGAVMPTLAEANTLDAGTLLTIPINGLVSADENGPVNINDPNRFTTRFKPEEPAKGSAFTLSPDPNAPVVYEDEFVNWVKVNYPYGTTDPTRPISFELDNEPDAWSAVHPEVHPNPVTYSELINDTINYATAIKNVEPNALIYGPVDFGWPGIYNLNNASDASQHGQWIPYYLQQMAAASAAAGKRLVDVLDVHWYPVTGGLQAPRSLWDPTYTENDYITQYDTNGPIELIPRLQAEINQYFPGTKISISEYNYGSGNAIAGGIMEADALGIFGKEGVYSANEWELLSSEPYIGAAFNMFRDYDGNGGTFGNTSVGASTSDVTDTSVYASLDTTNPYHMVVVAINKTGAAINSTLALQQSMSFGQANVYQLTSAGAAPVFTGDMALSNPSSFVYSMPANSVSTLNLLSYPTWISAGGGSWGTSGNWSNGTIAGQSMSVADFTGNISGPSTITLDGTQTVTAVNFSSTQSYTLAAGTKGLLMLSNGTNTATMTDTSGAHAISAPISLASNVLATITNKGDSLTLSGPISGAGGMTVAGNGTLRFAEGKTLTTLTSLIVQTGATVDITTGSLGINYGSPAKDPIGTIVGYLRSGYSGGAWTGTSGIVSSNAASPGGGPALSVGYADGNTDFSNGAAANQVLVKFTLAGDATLDGIVDFNDLFAVGKHLNTTGNDWAEGNLNYDPAGSVNFNDLFIIGQELNTSIANMSFVVSPLTTIPVGEVAQVAVPEPGCVVLAYAGAASLLLRRRRRTV